MHAVVYHKNHDPDLNWFCACSIVSKPDTPDTGISRKSPSERKSSLLTMMLHDTVNGSEASAQRERVEKLILFGESCAPENIIPAVSGVFLTPVCWSAVV